MVLQSSPLLDTTVIYSYKMLTAREKGLTVFMKTQNSFKKDGSTACAISETGTAFQH